MQTLVEVQKITEIRNREAQVADYIPVRILEVEIGQALPRVSAIDEKTGHSYQRARSLVRLHTHPVGLVEFPIDESGVNADQYAQLIWDSLGVQINEHLAQDSFSPIVALDAAGLPGVSTPPCLQEREQFLAHAPFVSVIVPTHNRISTLSSCLHSLLSLDYPQYEIIVVDNAPSTNETAEYIQQQYWDEPKVRYIREDRPGPSFARNCGILAAQGKILAFPDDDVVVDRYWLVELVKAFSLAEDVACVTGFVLPMELETPAQFLFEEYGGFTRGYKRRIFDMKENHPKTISYPYAAGNFGTGASMAFTAAFLHSVGGFDPVLGGNSAVKCSQDIAAFFQVIIKGHTLVYEPAAILYHLHRREYTALRKQMYNYGVGWTAYLMKCLLDNPGILWNFLAKVPYGVISILSTHSPKYSKKTTQYPKDLTQLELRGMLYGPLAYFQSRWAMHKGKPKNSGKQGGSILSLPKEI